MSSSEDSSSLASMSSFEAASNAFIAKRKARRKQERKRKRHGGGSRPGKKANKERRRAEYDMLLKADYFNNDAIFDSNDFRRRFRMRRRVFDRILNALVAHDDYFRQKADCTGNMGFSPHQKVTCALRYLAYGKCYDELDEQIRMGASTVAQTVAHFCKGVIPCFGRIYLRPTFAPQTRKTYRKS